MVQEAITHHGMEKTHKQGFWYGFNVTAIILIIIFALGIPLLHVLAFFFQSVDITAHQTEASFAYTPTTFTIEIQNEDSTPLNAVEFELAYDPSAVLITSIVPHTTLCEEQFVITNSINTASGTALFQCGTITPFTGKQGTIATVHAIPLKTGTSSISFGPLTHVLAHDGYGTDTTRTRTDLILTAL